VSVALERIAAALERMAPASARSSLMGR